MKAVCESLNEESLIVAQARRLSDAFSQRVPESKTTWAWLEICAKPRFKQVGSAFVVALASISRAALVVMTELMKPEINKIYSDDSMLFGGLVCDGDSRCLIIESGVRFIRGSSQNEGSDALWLHVERSVAHFNEIKGEFVHPISGVTLVKVRNYEQ